MADDSNLRPVLVRLLEGRVGSTLVMQLLGTAPEIMFDRVYPFENSYLTYLTRLVGQIAAPRPEGTDMIQFLYGDTARVGPLPFPAEQLACDAFARDSLRSVWQAFSRAMQATTASPARFYAEKYWGDVTPVVAAGLEPIVVDLVRDPRDVVASVRAFITKSGRQRFGRAQARDDDEHVRRLAAGMGFRLQEFALLLPVTHLTIRYEDLVAELRAEVARLETAIGVRLEVNAVSDALPAMAHHVTSASPDRSVGRWVRDLSPEEVGVIERRLGEQMVGLGYTLSTEHESRDRP